MSDITDCNTGYVLWLHSTGKIFFKFLQEFFRLVAVLFALPEHT